MEYLAAKSAGKSKHQNKKKADQCPYNITNIFKVDGNSEKLGKISISMCPGKRDLRHSRNLDQDLTTISQNGVDVIICLLPWCEMRLLGIADYPSKAKKLGIPFYHVPIADMGIPNYQQLDTIIPIVVDYINNGFHVLIHCRCGLGRAGTICACCLGFLGYDWIQAINLVRNKRHGAIQNSSQERCIMKYCTRINKLYNNK